MKENKYRSLFTEDLTELQADTLFFITAKKIKGNDEETKLLIEAWSENNDRILDEAIKESREGWLTQAVQ